jgi:hypothetical protein
MIRGISTSDMPGKELLLRLKRSRSCTSLSPRALALVIKWSALHRAELMEDWTLAGEDAQLSPIAPLE